MIAFEVDTSGLTKMERALTALAERQLPYAMAQALNDCTRAASVEVNKAMETVFDRPTPFTEKAAIAPRTLAATRDHLVATVTLRDIQAKYLLAEEQGGTRAPSENTRKPGQALVLPGKGLDLDAYGNIPSGTLRRLKSDAKANQRARRKRLAAARKQADEKPPPVNDDNTVTFLAAGVAGNKAGIGGYFRRLAGRHLQRLTAFEGETHYHARMGYHARVHRVFEETWQPALLRRLLDAVASAR